MNKPYSSLIRASWLCVLPGLLGVTLSVSPVQADENMTTGGDVAHGAQEWANNCARCHEMRDATEFRDDLWEPIVTHMRVRAGLTGQQARDILEFLQAGNYQPRAATVPAAAEAGGAAKAEDGKAVYGQTCIACHGADGKGVLPGTPDFTAAGGPLSKPDSVLLQHVISGFQSPGSPMAMPPRGGNPHLSDENVHEALEYMRQQFGRQ